MENGLDVGCLAVECDGAATAEESGVVACSAGVAVDFFPGDLHHKGCLLHFAEIAGLLELGFELGVGCCLVRIGDFCCRAVEIVQEKTEQTEHGETLVGGSQAVTVVDEVEELGVEDDRPVIGKVIVTDVVESELLRDLSWHAFSRRAAGIKSCNDAN